MRIYKYPLELRSGEQRFAIKAHNRILAFQMQGDTPTIWAEVHPDTDTVFMAYRIVATGEESPPRPWYYYGTVQTRGGLVFHLYINPHVAAYTDPLKVVTPKRATGEFKHGGGEGSVRVHHGLPGNAHIRLDDKDGFFDTMSVGLTKADGAVTFHFLPGTPEVTLQWVATV